MPLPKESLTLGSSDITGCLKMIKFANVKLTKYPKPTVGKCLLHFIDLGENGNSTLIQTPTHNILIDVGMLQGTANVVAYLQNAGISTIHLLVLSHPHYDHIGYGANGIQTILDNFTVDQIWSVGHPYPVHYDGVTEWPNEGSLEIYGQVLSQIFPDGYTVRGQGEVPGIVGEPIIPYHEPRAENNVSIYNFGDLTINVLWPKNDLTTPYSLPNVQSLVMQLVWSDTKIMIMNDATAITSTEILSRINSGILDIDVSSDLLCLGHHARNDGTSEEWLQAVNPSVTTAQSTVIPIADGGDKVAALLKKYNIQFFRPADWGYTIVIESDGTSVKNLYEYSWQDAF